MPITVPVCLTPAEEAALCARAKAEGVSVDSLLHQAVVQLLSGAAAGGPECSRPRRGAGKGVPRVGRRYAQLSTLIRRGDQPRKHLHS